MTGWLLDTTVLIDVSRGHAVAVDFLERAQTSDTPLFVSVVSAMELIAGCRDKSDVAKAQHLISDLELVQISPVTSAQAYELVLTYSKSHGLSIPDALIAATALVQEVELATDNDRHFQMIPRLKIFRPY